MRPFNYAGTTFQFSERIGTVFGATTAGVHHTRLEFWIRTDQGQELPVQLQSVDFPVANGQRVGAISAESSDFNRPVLVQLINYNARMSSLVEPSIQALAVHVNKAHPWGSRLRWTGLGVLVIGAFLFPWLWLAVIVLAFFAFRRGEGSAEFRRQLSSHLLAEESDGK